MLQVNNVETAAGFNAATTAACLAEDRLPVRDGLSLIDMLIELIDMRTSFIVRVFETNLTQH
jgi:hypothetical protein